MTYAEKFLDALNVRVNHAAYSQAFEDLSTHIKMSETLGGSIIPLLGPTRVGKTDLVEDARDEFGRTDRGPGVIFQSLNFAVGSIPPKPNDRDLYVAMLRAIGYDCSPKEQTARVRDRLLSVIRKEGIKFLAIDECSHCAEPGANLSPRAAADHFKTVVDATGVTLILSGLPKFQNLLEQNEQFRERSMSTIMFRPYSWSEPDDQMAFEAAVNSMFGLLQDAGAEVDFDEFDMMRRLFGLSGGRVGLVMKVLKAACSALSTPRISFNCIAQAARKSTQGQLSAVYFFDLDNSPSDEALSRAYVSVCHDAGMEVKPKSIAEYSALQYAANNG